MKHLQTFLLLWLFSFFSYGQIIEINKSSYSESSYAPEKLVKEVLISSNCNPISNFSQQVIGSPTSLTSKSYGYFKTPSVSTFPFEEGIVLTIGSAHPAGNVKSDLLVSVLHNSGGDSDLE